MFVKGDSTTNARDDSAATWLEVGSLRPWDRNPRKNESSVSPVAESIKRLGFGAPILARREGMRIVAGHTRWKAARLLADAWPRASDRERAQWHADAVRIATEKVVPVRVLDLSEHDATLLALADNRLNELAPWDVPELQAILSEVGLADAALAGWSAEDLEKMAADLLKDSASEDDELAEDQSSKATTGFGVLIDCADEQEQLHVIAECERMGFKCRGLV